MSETVERKFGVWRLTVMGPEALLNVYAGTVEVEGLGAGDPHDRRNLEFHAANLVAQQMGFKSYDNLPDQYTPMEFAEPVLGTNEYCNPDGTQQWFVGVYSIGRCYGGPEEGGWWYDTGQLVRHTAVRSFEEAEELRQRLYDGEFPETGRSSSVLGGEDYGIKIGIRPHPASFPESVPRYE